MSARILTVLAAVALAGSAVPVGLEIATRTAAGPPNGAANVRVSVRSEGSAAEPVAGSVALGQTLRLTIAPGAVEVEGQLEGHWAAPVRVELPHAGPVELLFHPADRMRWPVVLPRAVGPPPALEVRFEPPPGPASSSGPRGRVLCPLSDAVADCLLPRGVLDLSFQVAGLAPVRLWEHTVAAHAPRAPLVFHEGGTIVGRVEGAAALPAETRVELHRWSAAVLRDARAELRAAREVRRTHLQARGFYEFAGVAAGSFVVEVTAPGYAATRTPPVEVRDRSSLVRAETLRLQRPVDLEVRLQPPLAPGGKAWRLRLSSEPPARASTAGFADRLGRWRARDLSPGRYALSVSDGRDDWHGESVEVGSTGTVLDVALPLVHLRGLLVRGHDPLPGVTLVLERAPGKRLRFETDDAGRFEGFVTEPGTWLARVLFDGLELPLDDVEVPQPAGAPTVEVELRVPDTHLGGTVVDEQGRPVAGARVRATVVGPGALTGGHMRGLATATTNAQGEFSLVGLPADKLALRAEEGRRSSDWTTLALAEDRPEAVKLVLRSPGTWSGRVVGPLGPVTGARVLAWPAQAGSTPVGLARTLSGADGRFVLELPAAVNQVALLVSAGPGAVRVQALSGPPAQPVDVFVGGPGGRLVLSWRRGHTPSDPAVELAGVGVPAGVLALVSGQQPGRQHVELTDAPAGRYALCPTFAREAGPCASGELPPGGLLELVLPVSSPSAGL